MRPFGNNLPLDKLLAPLFAVAVIGIAMLLATSSAAQQAGSSATLSVQEQFNSITPEQQDKFDIKEASWVNPAADNPNTTANESFPGYALLVGCQGCAGAEYDGAGNLVNAADLGKVPTSWIYRVPENWNGKMIVQIPPRRLDQTFFPSYLRSLLKEGYAVAMLFHSSPGADFFFSQYSEEPQFHAQELANAYSATGHLLKDLTSEIFGAPIRTLSLGQSGGILRGNGLLVGRDGSPFDGFVMVEGGNGVLTRYEYSARSLLNGRIDKTCLPILEASLTDAQKTALLADVLAVADPEYREIILGRLSEGDVSGAYSLAVNYNVSDRPKKVQQEWEDLEFSPDIRSPLIIVEGGRDLVLHPPETVLYAQRIYDAGKSGLMRLYLYKEMGHQPAVSKPAPPDGVFIDAIHKVDSWAETGNPPASDLAGGVSVNAGGVIGVIPPQPSCGSSGLPIDPTACFNNMLGQGFVGFCSNDSATACVSDNPTTSQNEDTCVPAGKGSCDLASPFPNACSG